MEWENQLIQELQWSNKISNKASKELVAQEIAGLLGETTAETKTTLTKLCRSLLDEGSESEVK